MFKKNILKMNKVKIESTLQNKAKQKKSIFNSSSTVFFVINNPKDEVYTEVSLLNHFLIKRGISDVKAEVVLRTLNGNEVDRFIIELTSKKTYSFNPCRSIKDIFIGSVSIYFNSKQNLAVPFCAVVMSLKTKGSVCTTHTYGRRLEDKELGSSIDIPETTETGWTLRDTAQVKSFAVFHNGKFPSDINFLLEISNYKGDVYSQHFSKSVSAHETFIIIPQDIIPNLLDKLHNNLGHARVKIKGITGVFPRLLCGNYLTQIPNSNNNNNNNMCHIEEIQFTHTNFDFGQMEQPDSENSIGYFNHPDLPAGYGLCYPVETEKEISINSNKYIPNKLQKIDVLPFQQLKVKSKKGNLPSRFVAASIGKWRDKIIESECSTGTFIEDNLKVPCHWHWGLLKPKGESGKSTISIFVNDFTKTADLDRTINMSFYNQEGLIFEKKVSIKKNIIIKSEDCYPNNFDKDSIWYVFQGERLEDLNIFSTFWPDNKSGSCEHAF